MSAKDTVMNDSDKPVIFDIINSILYKKDGGTLWEKYQNFDYSRWLLIRFLSMHPDLKVKEVVLQCEAFKTSMDNKEFYLLLYKAIPRATFAKIDYIKKISEDRESSKENIAPDIIETPKQLAEL